MRKTIEAALLAATLALSLAPAMAGTAHLADSQQEATATWTLSDGTESDMNATMSADGLASVATMTVGSGLTVVQPQNIDGLSFYKVQPTVQTSTDDDTNALTFTITPKRGLTFTPTRFAMKAARFGTDGGTLDIVAAVGSTTLTLAEATTPNRNNSKTTAHYSDYSFDISGLQTQGEPMTIKVYVKNLSTCEPCNAPGPRVEGKTIKWDDVPYAICYVVSRGTDVVGFTTATEFTTTVDGDYTIQAANEFGGLSRAAHASVSTGIVSARSETSQNTVAGIYTIDGKLLNHFAPGVNIVRYSDGTVRKVAR